MVKDNAGSVAGFAMIVVVLNLFTCGLAIGVTLIARRTPTRRSTASRRRLSQFRLHVSRP